MEELFKVVTDGLGNLLAIDPAGTALAKAAVSGEGEAQSQWALCVLVREANRVLHSPDYSIH